MFVKYILQRPNQRTKAPGAFEFMNLRVSLLLSARQSRVFGIIVRHGYKAAVVFPTSPTRRLACLAMLLFAGYG